MFDDEELDDDLEDEDEEAADLPQVDGIDDARDALDMIEDALFRGNYGLAIGYAHELEKAAQRTREALETLAEKQ
jgi:hypothetical protein